MVAYIDDDEVVIEMADYFADPVQLTAPEALSLIASGLAMLSTGEAPEALRRAVDKLVAAIFPDAGEVLTVDLPEPGMVGELRRAAADHRVVHLVYTAIAGDRTTERDVEPWLVFSTLGNWYVTGHCRLARDERVFRIDRIRDLRTTGDRFEPPAETPPPLVSYNRGDDDVVCEIRLGPAPGGSSTTTRWTSSTTMARAGPPPSASSPATPRWPPVCCFVWGATPSCCGVPRSQTPSPTSAPGSWLATGLDRRSRPPTDPRGSATGTPGDRSGATPVLPSAR